MKAKIKAWLELQQLTGIEVVSGKDGLEEVSACSLELKQNKVQVTAQKVSLKNLPHFVKNFKPGPVALCLSGKNVLSRKTAPVTAVDPLLINSLWPNIKYEDFYFQLVAAGGESVVSLIRRAEADVWIAALADQGFPVIALCLGKNASVMLDEQDQQQVEPLLLPAYSAALTTLLGIDNELVNDTAIQHSRDQELAKLKVRKIGLCAVVTCFLVLVVNFLFYQHYSGEADRLSQARHLSAERVGTYQDMEKDIIRKQKLIKSVGWTGGYPTAYLTDQLAACKPKDILLTAFLINPVKEEPGTAGKKEVMQVNTVLIEGFCDQAGTLNNWISEIRSKSWVKSCGVVNYDLSKDTGMGKFSIRIMLLDYEG